MIALVKIVLLKWLRKTASFALKEEACSGSISTWAVYLLIDKKFIMSTLCVMSNNVDCDIDIGISKLVPKMKKSKLETLTNENNPFKFFTVYTLYVIFYADLDCWTLLQEQILSICLQILIYVGYGVTFSCYPHTASYAMSFILNIKTAYCGLILKQN